jgi:cytochrome c556
VINLKDEQMMTRNSVLGIVLLYLVSALSVSRAQSAPATPQQEAEKAVKTRQAVFDVQSYSFGPVAAMLKGAPFDADLVQKEAARVEITSGMIVEVFQFDTRKFRVQTTAREDIWLHPDDFKQKARDLQAAVAELKSAATKGDRSAVINAVNGVGQACKACHDAYREK